eukprot:s1253_g20.t1
MISILNLAANSCFSISKAITIDHLALPGEGSGMGSVTDLVLHQAVYNSCDEEFDVGGKSSTWLLLEHALARLYQVRDGTRVPDMLLLVVPSDAAYFGAIRRTICVSKTSDWLYVVESPPSGQSWPCATSSCQSAAKRKSFPRH